MIKPYTAVGLIPTVRGIRRRADIKINLEHLSHLVKAASWLSSLDLPVRLIAFPEGALQAFNDEVLDLDHAQFAQECAIDIPGEETEALGCSRSRAAPGPSIITCTSRRRTWGRSTCAPRKPRQSTPLVAAPPSSITRAASTGSRTTGLVPPMWEA